MLAKPQPDPNAVLMAIPILGYGTQDLTSKGQSSAMPQKTSQLQSAAAPERHVEKMHCLDVVSLNMSKQTPRNRQLEVRELQQVIGKAKDSFVV